jgi:hypothetical protein
MAEEKNDAAPGGRSKEDIALDMMKFIAVTTGYGKSAGTGAGFNKTPIRSAEEHAESLLELYAKCRKAIG